MGHQGNRIPDDPLAPRSAGSPFTAGWDLRMGRPASRSRRRSRKGLASRTMPLVPLDTLPASRIVLDHFGDTP